MPATVQKLAQGEESRRRLLHAAAELLGVGGYSGTSVQAIATRAGCVKSALYWHFGSKDGLLFAALEASTGEWVGEVEEAIAVTDEPLARLEGLVAHVRSVIAERPQGQHMIFSILLERGGEDPQARRAVARLLGALHEALGRGLAEAVALPTEACKPIAEDVIYLCHGLFLTHLADPDMGRLDRALDRIRSLVVRRMGKALKEHGGAGARGPS